MSKASEWAESDESSKAVWRALRFQFPVPSDGTTFLMAKPVIDDRYGLGVNLIGGVSGGTGVAFVTSAAFLALCRWGLETFGEEP